MPFVHIVMAVEVREGGRDMPFVHIVMAVEVREGGICLLFT